MKKLILLAGAAVFAAGSPALADPGNGNGKHGKVHSSKSHAKAGKAHSKHLVTTRNGSRLYALSMRGTCPPGLAKRGNGCMPPGQAKKTYNVGQRYNRNFGNVWTYNQIPMALQSQYQFDQNDRYYYRNGYLYQVDPRTMLIEQIVSTLLR